MDEKNPWAHDVTLIRENFRADPRAKMAEMENEVTALQYLACKVAELQKQLAARDAEIAQLKRNLNNSTEWISIEMKLENVSLE